MTFSDPEKLMLDTLRDFRNVFGPFELKATLPNVTLATERYPLHTEYREYPAIPADASEKHKLHDMIMSWRAKR